MANGSPHTSFQSLALKIERILAMFTVRLALSVAIIVSLIPIEGHGWIEIVFLAVFAMEFILRSIAFAAPKDSAIPRGLATRRFVGKLLFLFLDLLALLSFVPWPHSPQEARWLRIFRLTRLLVLISYWGNVARDIWSILSRRERARQLALMTLSVALMAFTGAVVLEQLTATGVDFNNDGALTPADSDFFTRLWWSFRQMEDPGNLIGHPRHTAALVVSLTLTIFGLFLVSFLIGLGTDVVHELMSVSRSRPLGLSNHSIIIHSDATTHRLLKELLSFYEKVFAVSRYLIVGRDEDPPDFLVTRELPWCSYRQAIATSPQFLARSDAASAQRLVILAREDAPSSDAETVETILNFREVNSDAWVVAEILDHSNAAAARVAGGDHTTVVSTEKLLALYLASTALLPNHDQLRHELLTSHGHEVYTFYYNHADLQPDAELLMIPEGCQTHLIQEAALQFSSDAPVIPLAIIRDTAQSNVEFLHRCPPENFIPPGPVQAIVVLARSFDTVTRFALWLRTYPLADAPKDNPPHPPFPVLSLDRLDAPLKKVLICGYRPAAINLCEALLTLDQDMDILLLVEHEKHLISVTALIEERNTQIGSGLLIEHGPVGYFQSREPYDYSFVPSGQDSVHGRLRLAVNDWTQERVLFNLPADFGTVHQCDLVVFFSDGTDDADARTSMAILKLAHAVGKQPDSFPKHFQLLGQVDQHELAQRLGQRYQSETGILERPIRVVAHEELRALFTFQAAMIPGFDAIYSELLSPSGPSLLRLLPRVSEEEGNRPWSFKELSHAFKGRNQIPLALVYREGVKNTRLSIAPPSDVPEDSFRFNDLEALWVIGERTH
jgi:hypothetical protein